jgi:hypothetical protein
MYGVLHNLSRSSWRSVCLSRNIILLKQKSELIFHKITIKRPFYYELPNFVTVSCIMS